MIESGYHIVASTKALDLCAVMKTWAHSGKTPMPNFHPAKTVPAP
ncbi:hypothetical protein BFJ67_g15636 [Fusarium oxysporum f. sp. cepae]|nr:hypothetical protein BFJ67_g15636 [Fusarium oxysporum f. sp. cepae]